MPESNDIGETWLDTSTDEETLAEARARGGSLSTAGRRAAIAASLPVLGLYFSSGNQELSATPAVGKGHVGESTPQLLAGIRLRVALAAAARLECILSRIIERPTFRYELRSHDVTGAVTGQLDTNRYATRVGVITEATSYPVAFVERGRLTAENILAAYVTLWLIRELKSSYHSSVAPPSSPEGADYRLRLRYLKGFSRMPAFASCVARAREIRGSKSELALIETTKSRLRRREVSNATPYEELVTWVEGALDGRPVVEAGDLDWSFYGDRFDTKLFELWCLHALASEISRQLCVDLPPINLDWRSGHAAYTWERPAGILQLNYQRSVSSISGRHPAQWVRSDSRPLGGIPDIVAHAVERASGVERFAIIDPKLRQRGGSPTEELYKVLGYLYNFDLSDSPNGAILYHTTSEEELPVYQYGRVDADGRLYAVALNPAESLLSQRSLQPIASMCLALLDIPPLNDQGWQSNSDDPESVAEVRARARTRELEALAITLPKSELEASKRRVEALIGKTRWGVLSEEVQTMMATSEHVGFALDPAADFSGPVIGICASTENILHERVLSPAIAHDASLGNSCKTLGQVIHATIKALTNGSSPLHDAIRARLEAINADTASVLQLMQDMSNMNKQYRIPAAHKGLVSEVTWQSAWTLIVGANALLARLIDHLVYAGPSGASS